MIPRRAYGSTTPVIVRQWLIPSASEPLCSVFGTSRITSWLVREISGSMMIASASEAA